MTPRPGTSIAPTVLLIAGLLLIAGNLRLPITAVAPVLDDIRESFGLSATSAGMLTALPVAAFALCSPFAAMAAHAWGAERSLLIGLALLAVGILVRSSGSLALLYVGTGLIGAGIATCNVLLPALVKHHFPTRIATLTCIYVLLMNVAAALGSVIVVPLAGAGGQDWRFALACLAAFALVAALVWLPQLRVAQLRSIASAERQRLATPVWRHALAWQVSLFFGLNSFIFYAVIGWLPSILRDAGYTAEYAGDVHGALQLAAAVACTLLLPLVRWVKDQRVLAVGAAIATMASMLGLALVPQWAAAWATFYGFMSGANLILGLTFVSMRAGDAQQAMSLSGMAQAVGYLLAAAGPALVGAAHDSFGDWRTALCLCAASAALTAVFGAFAGRSVQLSQRRASPATVPGAAN